ncbi:MAG: hypothetical protein ACKPKO_03280, partial [Candidatus Fonsibacter sp.]
PRSPPMPVARGPRQHPVGTYRIRLTNLPIDYADGAPQSAGLLGQLILEYLDVHTYNIKTYMYSTNASRTHAYAFL